eukprot:6205034-Pleurochrysis_carterae.AAC.1
MQMIMPKISQSIIFSAMAVKTDPTQMIKHVQSLIRSHFLMLHLAMTDARTDGSIDYKNETVRALLKSAFGRAFQNYNMEFSKDIMKANAVSCVEIMQDDGVVEGELDRFIDDLKTSSPPAVSQILDLLHCMARNGNRKNPVNYAINQYLQYVKKRVPGTRRNVNNDMIQRLNVFLESLLSQNEPQ